MEEHKIGTAGIAGGIFNTTYIALIALYAYAFFNEVMSTSAIVGAAMIAFAILFATGVRLAREYWAKPTIEGEDEEKQFMMDK